MEESRRYLCFEFSNLLLYWKQVDHARLKGGLSLGEVRFSYLLHL